MRLLMHGSWPLLLFCFSFLQIVVAALQFRWHYFCATHDFIHYQQSRKSTTCNLPNWRIIRFYKVNLKGHMERKDCSHELHFVLPANLKHSAQIESFLSWTVPWETAWSHPKKKKNLVDHCRGFDKISLASTASTSIWQSEKETCLQDRAWTANAARIIVWASAANTDLADLDRA